MNWDLLFILEVINGAWAILSLGLFIVCAFYLHHEFRARGFKRKKWTSGMRVASSIATLSLGIAITRSVIFIWRHVYRGDEFSAPQNGLLVVGAGIGALGFVCAIRELSQPLYGRMPWIIAITLAAIFVVMEMASRFT